MLFNDGNLSRPEFVYPRLIISTDIKYHELMELLELDNQYSNALLVETEIRANILLGLKRGMASWS